ncbi:MAG TPA: metallopeptidase TldD-related protein [Bryobacteraceae bacterium]|nr:metallopeptidase TldD-related protein [Bryobacteraceae bacterium]
MRTLICVLPLVASAVWAQSPLTQTLSAEMERNFTILKQKGDPPPYFMAYEVTETEGDVLAASEGSLDGENHGHSRILDVTVRTGSPQFDNYRRAGNAAPPNFTPGMSIALDDNPAAIRQEVWLATDRVYRRASQALIRLKADQRLQTAPSDGSADFSSEEPQVFYGKIPKLKFNAADWSVRLRKLSGEFRNYPGALNSGVAVEARRVSTTFVNTEGTKIEQGRLFTRLVITANGKAADGMDLSTMESFDVDDPSKLPNDTQILAAVKKAGSDLTALLKAPPADPYVGPAILSGRAAGVFFHEIFGHRVEGHRQKDESEGQTFTKSVNMPVLPSFLSVIFDPTEKQFNGTPLNGSYDYDDEGVKARRVPVVEDGILKTFLLSRSPIQGFPHSNGHGRREAGYEIVSRQSNLFVKSSKTVSDAELRKMLIAEVKRQGKPYGLYFDQVTSGYTTTSRRGLQAFTVVPLTVYRVYPDGRPDELIRGVDIVGTPLASFAKIVATSDKMEIFNGYCGAESGTVPVAAIAPALLVSEIEIQRKERSQDRPPYLSRPPETGASASGQSEIRR